MALKNYKSEKVLLFSFSNNDTLHLRKSFAPGCSKQR